MQGVEVVEAGSACELSLLFSLSNVLEAIIIYLSLGELGCVGPVIGKASLSRGLSVLFNRLSWHLFPSIPIIRVWWWLY